MELNTALQMMHGILVGLDQSPRNPSDRCKLRCNEMPSVQWDVMQGRDSRHKQGRDKTLPSKDESEARSMTSDDRCSADAKRQKSKRDCERLDPCSCSLPGHSPISDSTHHAMKKNGKNNARRESLRVHCDRYNKGLFVRPYQQQSYVDERKIM